MSVLTASIKEVSQNFFHSDPFKFDKYFAITPDYQKYCLSANLPTCFTITLAKEAMLIHDIAIHLLAGGVKLTTGTVKGICAIASGILGIETDHQTPSKQAVIHFGFACLYFMDFFISITSINNRYPQPLVDKVKKAFATFLEVPNKEITIKYVANPEIEEALLEEQRKAKEREELLKTTRQELKEIRNSDFISEEEFQEISKEAQKITNSENYIEEDSIIITTESSIIDKLGVNPFQYELTYGSVTGSDNDLSTNGEEGDFWLDDGFEENGAVTRNEKNENPYDNTINLSKETASIEEQKTPASKNSNEKPLNKKNSHQITVHSHGFRPRISEYSEKVKKRNKGQSANS